jgi:hypothetical protein
LACCPMVSPIPTIDRKRPWPSQILPQAFEERMPHFPLRQN